MGWLRLVGSLKTWVSFAKEPYKRDHILQKSQIFLRSLLIIATPYVSFFLSFSLSHIDMWDSWWFILTYMQFIITYMCTHAYICICAHMFTHSNPDISKCRNALAITSRWNYGYILINAFTFMYIPINSISMRLSNSSQDRAKLYPQQQPHTLLFIIRYECAYVYIYSFIHTHT